VELALREPSAVAEDSAVDPWDSPQGAGDELSNLLDLVAQASAGPA
jgi:hypothetical protein